MENTVDGRFLHDLNICVWWDRICKNRLGIKKSLLGKIVFADFEKVQIIHE